MSMDPGAQSELRHCHRLPSEDDNQYPLIIESVWYWGKKPGYLRVTISVLLFLQVQGRKQLPASTDFSDNGEQKSPVSLTRV